MYLQEARATALYLTATRRLDHLIIFDGVNYSVCLKNEYTGTAFEVVKYNYKKPHETNKNTEPIKEIQAKKGKGAKKKSV